MMVGKQNEANGILQKTITKSSRFQTQNTARQNMTKRNICFYVSENMDRSRNFSQKRQAPHGAAVVAGMTSYDISCPLPPSSDACLCNTNKLLETQLETKNQHNVTVNKNY